MLCFVTLRKQHLKRRKKNTKYKTKQNKESLERGEREREKLDAKLRDIQRFKR